MQAETNTDTTIDLRWGRWQEALADVDRCDAVITDPPFSARTINGYRSGSKAGERAGRQIAYDAFPRGGADELAEWVRSRHPWFFVAFCDHHLFRMLERSFDRVGWYSFAPVQWVKKNPSPRQRGDGPTSGCEPIFVARPRRRSPKGRSGSRPGYYVHGAVKKRDRIMTGQKPVELVRRIVEDYTLPGDLVVDPYAGSGTTLAAAALCGRNAIGAEMNSAIYTKAHRRLQEL